MKTTQRERVRQHLIESGSITTGYALHIMKPEIRQLHERIRELIEDGMKIEGDWVRVDGRRTKEYRYVLVEKPVPKKRIVYEPVVRDGVRVMVAKVV